MHSWRRHYLHSGFDPVEETILAWRGRALAVTCLIASVTCLVVGLNLVFYEAWPMAFTFALVGLVSFALPLVQRDATSLARSSHIIIGGSFVAIVTSSIFRGGMSSQFPMLLLMMPILAAYLFHDRHNVLMWAIASGLAWLGVSIIPLLLDVPLVDRMPIAGREMTNYFVPLVALVLITALAHNNTRVEMETIGAATAAERERVEVEQANRLQRSEQMALVGRLAVGVAHEVNNPLAYIGANIDFTAKRLRKDDERRWNEEVEALRDASDGVHRIADIVTQLNAHGRQEEETIQPLRLRDSLELTLRILRNQLRHRARIYRQYTDHPVVQADPGRLTQVFLNVLVNAAQALPTGKRNENEIRIELRRDGDDAVVEITDTGKGIDPALLQRVTEPFFTTHDIGQGVGLGLSISDAIVRAYGGTLLLSSQLGKGTCVRVRMPISEDEPITLREEEPPELTIPSSPREPRILLIDDDATVRRGLARVLPGTIVQAGHVNEALDALDEDPSFDAIICDVMMPDLTGIDFYRELTARNPDLASRTLFLTGGVFEQSALDFIKEHEITVLNKPVRRQDLTAAVEELMNSGESAQD